jgi:hypothetical protein
MMEIGTYASLLNQKILVPSPEANFTFVEKHFLTDCMVLLLQSIRVDAQWYLREYPDVQEAITLGAVPDAKAHYCRFGFYEHRMPYRIVVDETWYLAEYADVRVAIAGRHFSSGQAHFDVDGFREGRIPYPNFQLETVDVNRLNGHVTPVATSVSNKPKAKQTHSGRTIEALQ